MFRRLSARSLRSQNRSSSRKSRRFALAQVEQLDDRVLLSGASRAAALSVASATASATGGATPQTAGYASPQPGVGVTPAQAQSAYGYTSTGYDGSGQTIYIIDAYSNPNISADLTQFDQETGISALNLTVLGFDTSNPGRLSSTLPGIEPAGDPSDWIAQEDADVEWAHAAAPGASIVLVETPTDALSELIGAAGYVGTSSESQGYLPAQAVLMGWGQMEVNIQNEQAYDANFLANGVTFVVASGYAGATYYPACSPNVLSVGGTDLTASPEGPWSGSGGGSSLHEPQPTYQVGIVPGYTRSAADVSASGNSDWVLDSYEYGSATPWTMVSGTNLGAAQWAGVIAQADQARLSVSGLGDLTGYTQTLPLIYGMNRGVYNDIWPSGYDTSSGLGSPKAPQVVHGLADPPDSKAAAVGLGTQIATFARGQQGDLLENVYGSSGWVGWFSLSTPGTALIGNPVTINFGSGETDAFSLGADNKIYVDTYNGSWNWTPLGAPSGVTFQTTPTVVNDGTAGMSLFATGSDGKLWSNIYLISSSKWLGWGPVSTPAASLVGAPVAGNNGPNGHSYVFALDQNGNAESAFWNGSTWTWTNLGHPASTQFDASVTISGLDDGSGVETVFARGGDGYLYGDQYVPSTGWGGWFRVDATGNPALTGNPAPISMSWGAEVWATGSNGNLYYDSYNGSWSWVAMGAPAGVTLTGSPTVVNNSQGYYFVIVQGADGNLYLDTWNGSKWVWSELA